MKLHHIHAGAQASRLELDDIGQLWRGEGGGLKSKRDVALRLATCWNVLEGIPTEELARGILRDLFMAIDAGDLAAAQALVARFDAGVELTPEGNAHACTSCLATEGSGP